MKQIRSTSVHDISCIVTHHDATNGVVSNENYVSPTNVIFVLKLTRNHFSFSPFLEFTSETRHTHTPPCTKINNIYSPKKLPTAQDTPRSTRVQRPRPRTDHNRSHLPSFLPSFLSFFLFFSFPERCPFHLFHLEGEKKQKKKKNRKRNKETQQDRSTGANNR